MRLRAPTIVLVVMATACEGGARMEGSPGRQDASMADASSGADGGFFTSNVPDAAGTTEPEPTIRFELSPPGDAARPCAWAIPAAPDGQAIDSSRLRLVVIRDGGAEYLGAVRSSDECGALRAWYFDDPRSPTQVILCSEACTTLDGTLALEVLSSPRPPPW